MSNLQSLQVSLQRYHEQIEQMTLSGPPIFSEEALLALLRVRDRIQTFLDAATSEPGVETIPSQQLVALAKDDEKVGEWNDALADFSALATWRKSLSPPAHHWWWHPKSTPVKSPWQEWFLGGVTIALLTICLALAKDISARFLTGAPGIWSSFLAIAPTAIALFATGGVLTKVGTQLIDRLLTRTPASPQQWPQVKAGLALALTVTFFLLHFIGLPVAANLYQADGKKQYFKEGKLESAQASFQRALQLNPNFPDANHHLALTYEDIRDFDSARAEYIKAVNAGLLTSVNNLARLQIVEDEDYESAAVLLLSALDDEARDREDAVLEYGLRKNLGWAWLEQGRLLEAEGELDRANRLEDNLSEPRPDAHCLIARVFEENKKAEAAQTSWEDCLRKINRPEDDRWAAMANSALSEANKPKSTANETQDIEEKSN